MRLIKYIVLLFVPVWISAQTTTQNYVVTTVPHQAESNPGSLTDANSNTVIKYYDGIGRLSQTVQKKITPAGADLVSAVEYDALGRLSKTWLPAVSSNNGAYYSSYASGSASANGDSKPYSSTEYDGSPLNRIKGQYGPGNSWYSNSKKVSTSYITNSSNVKYFYADNNKLRCNGNYASNTLHGVQTTDEDGKTVVEFTNKLGQKILSRVAGNHDTYYVYDDFGNLRYVLPPLAADNLSTNTSGFSETSGSTLDLYGYIYHYDSRKRVVEKKLPGTDWLYMVYDKADRLILTQDGNQRSLATKQWTVTKYDKFGKVLYTGLVNSNNTRQQMESSYSSSITNETYSGNGSTGGYSCSNLTPASLLTVNYYDNYSFLNFNTYSTIKTTLTNTVQSGYTNPDLGYVRSLLTGTCVYHLDDPSKFELTALYYDKYGRAVQSRASNHMGGYDIVYNKVDFTGKVTKTYKTHGINGASATYKETYTYTFDNAQRLLATTHKLNSGSTVTVSSNTYDNFGRVATKKVGGTLNTTTFTYNVRGWITGMSNNEFSEQLYYNDNPVSLPNFTACYNGNVSGMKWDIVDESLAYDRAYAFGYNNLNRLTEANYCGKNGTSTYSSVTGKYNTSYSYDKMGNIQTLTRKENGSNLNNLTYTYNGNQLKKVDNSWSPTILYGSEAFNDRVKIATEYIYDKNGNTTYDGNAGISTFDHNLLNLPEVVQFKDGHQNRYSYSADGRKLRSDIYTLNSVINVPQGTINPVPGNPADYNKVTTDYIENLVYQDGSLKQVQTPEGYWQNGVYYYYLKDHLGNTRVVLNSSGSVVEKNHYYPYGMRFYPESTSNSAALPFRYNGKEFESMNGLNRYDYGARFYDPALARWHSVDPLADKYQSWSPYNYTLDNPIRFIDPDGRWVKGAGLFRNLFRSDYMIAQKATERANSGASTTFFTGFNQDGTSSFRMENGSLGQILNENPGLFKNLMNQHGSSDLGKEIFMSRNRFATARDGMAVMNGIMAVTSIPGLIEAPFAIANLASGLRAANGVPKYLYHYTSREAAQSISQSGLRVGRDGFSYLTNKSTLSPLQAQIELALPANRALPNSLLRVNTSGLDPILIRRVQGNLPGLGAGGGTEFLFNQTIPSSAIKIIR